jgi:hypothetical protein
MAVSPRKTGTPEVGARFNAESPEKAGLLESSGGRI